MGFDKREPYQNCATLGDTAPETNEGAKYRPKRYRGSTRIGFRRRHTPSGVTAEISLLYRQKSLVYHTVHANLADVRQPKMDCKTDTEHRSVEIR